MVVKVKAVARPAYEKIDVDTIEFREDRAVFPLELLRSVAQVRQERTRKPTNVGVRRETYPYPLTGITYCAHCERQAAHHQNPKLKSRLLGKGAGIEYEIRRYRHKTGIKCGSQNRSVPAERLEADFKRLIDLLVVKDDSLDLMMELAIQADKQDGRFSQDVDLETQKQEAIALCNRRIEATIQLYGDGRMERDEYLRRMEVNEREIAHWQSRTTETEKLALELAFCIETLDKVTRLWEMGDDEVRQGLVRSLFEYVVYDLDTQRIVDFGLKYRADRFLTLRAALHQNDEARKHAEKEKDPDKSGSLGVGTDVLHTGFDLTSVYRAIVMVDLKWAEGWQLEWLYSYNPQPISPRSDKTQKQIERNEAIKARHAAAESVHSLAAEFGISEQRIHQILKDRRK